MATVKLAVYGATTKPSQNYGADVASFSRFSPDKDIPEDSHKNLVEEFPPP